MEAVRVRGRLHGKQIDLDEELDALDGEVEVIVRPITRAAPDTQDVFAFIRALPAGTRSKDDIDKQLAEERQGWGDR